MEAAQFRCVLCWRKEPKIALYLHLNQNVLPKLDQFRPGQSQSGIWLDWTNGICVHQVPPTSTATSFSVDLEDHCKTIATTGPLYRRDIVDISIIASYNSRLIIAPYLSSRSIMPADNEDMNQGWLWGWFRRDGLHKNLPSWGVHLQKWTLYSGFKKSFWKLSHKNYTPELLTILNL